MRKRVSLARIASSTCLRSVITSVNIVTPPTFPADRVPGPDLPAPQSYGAIGAFKAILIAAHHLARQRPPVKLLPTFCNLWEDLVVSAPNDLLITESGSPSIHRPLTRM